jgi:hypothetical protein
MKSPNHPSPPGKDLQFQLDLETQEVLIELNALLRSLGLPPAQGQAAIAVWEGKILIEEDPDTKLPLHYLPVSLIPTFIDQILEQLSAESRVQAIQFRDGSHAMALVVSLAAMLKLSKKHGDGGIDPSHELHNVVALKPSHGIAAAHTTSGAF